MSITFSSHADFLGALDRAHQISIASYSLTADLVHELEKCAHHGARVYVELTANLIGGNVVQRTVEVEKTIVELRDCGVDARIVVPADNPLPPVPNYEGNPCRDATLIAPADGTSPHTKEALVDGVLWLDDRDFPASGPDLIVRDDRAADVAAAADAMAGRPAHDGPLTFVKRDAIAQEVRAIRKAPPGDIDVSAEDFGTGDVEQALEARIRGGDRVRLLVNPRSCSFRPEQEGLNALKRAGAEIRSVRAADKMTVLPDCVWLGSANATGLTWDTGGQSDWGIVFTDKPTVDSLRERFEQAWNDKHTSPWRPRHRRHGSSDDILHGALGLPTGTPTPKVPDTPGTPRAPLLKPLGP